MLAAPAAGAGSCADGVDCLCDRLKDPTRPEYDPNLVFCDDMENPEYDDDKGTGWTRVNGQGIAQCTTLDPDNVGPEFDFVNEGTCAECCINVVKEGACEVAGENDCVFDGLQSLGQRFRNGRTGGFVGSPSIVGGPHKTFGFTMAIRWTTNYVVPGGSNGPANKTNQFGDQAAHFFFGTSATGTTSNVGRNHPFAAIVKDAYDPGYTLVEGLAGISDQGLHYRPDPLVYDWGTTHTAGQWICMQVHWRDWGSANAEMRFWVDGQLGVHIQGINMTAGTDPDGIDTFQYNQFYNGVQGPMGQSGYPGIDPAYRFEDNLVMTASDEPVSCQVIGFP